MHAWAMSMAGEEQHQGDGHCSSAEGGAQEHDMVVLVLREFSGYALRDHGAFPQHYMLVSGGLTDVFEGSLRPVTSALGI